MKIEKYFDKKERKEMFRTRFQLNNREFYPKADTRKKLNEIIDEIRAQVHRSKYDLAVPVHSPELQKLFEIHAPKIPKHHQRKIFERVAAALLSLLPDGVKITELKKAHFQLYIDLRRTQTAKQSKRIVLDETIDKELYSVSSALAASPLYFPELDNYQKPQIPKAAKGKKRRRERLVDQSGELETLLAELRREKSGKQTDRHIAHRKRLADDLEFRFETGLRRKEVARLEKKNYFPKEKALRDVKRWKTGTVTKFFPLSKRAVQIVENRLRESESTYIFTFDGESVASDYRTLREICKKININYGKFSEGGFIPHDLRHNFATSVIQHTDIKTVSELLGHSNIEQTSVYLQTDEDRLREAVRRGEKADLKREAASLYKGIRRGKIRLKALIETIENLTGK